MNPASLSGATPAIPHSAPKQLTSDITSASPAVSPTGNRPATPSGTTIGTRFRQLLNTKKLHGQPACQFDADWKTAAREICQGWVDAQAGHNVTTVSHIALSRMKALEYERKNLAVIHPDQRLLPATATTDDYYQAEIEAFLAAVGEKEPQAMLASFKLAGTGGLHRQPATIGATISNSLSVAIVLAPDPVSKAALVGTRLLTQIGTSAAVVAAGGRRFRNACTEDVMPHGKADAAPAAKRAPNMLQASMAVMRALKIKEVTRSLQDMRVAMQALERARNGGTVQARRDTRRQLELAFARVCHQLSVKSAYKAASESAKIEFIGNLRYLLTSYTGTAAVLSAAMIGIMTPLFIDAVVTGGLIGAATALTVVMYLGYQLSTGPARDGEEKSRRAIIALVKLLEVLDGEKSDGTRERGKAYTEYRRMAKVPRFASPATRQAIRTAARARLHKEMARISATETAATGIDLATNWTNYRQHLTDARAIAVNPEHDKLTPPERQQQLTDHDNQFRDHYRHNFSVKELVAAWKTPMLIRMSAASRLLKGKVAQSHKRLLALKPGATAGTGHGRTGQTDQSKRAIKRQKQDLRGRLLDMFNLELALQDLQLAAGATPDSINLARATERIAAITDTDVHQLFCGSAEQQVEAIRQSKELTAGESERYTHANVGSAAIGIVVNIGVPAADLTVTLGKSTKAFKPPEVSDFKLTSISQAGAQPGAHLSAGDRAAFQLSQMQPALAATELKVPAPEYDMHIAPTGNALQPEDAEVKHALDTLMDQLWEPDVVPRTLRLTLQHGPADAARPSTSAAAPAPVDDEKLTVNLKPTTAYHAAQYNKNPLGQRLRHERRQVAIIGRQAAMSIAGLPVQALAQPRLKNTRAVLNDAAELAGKARTLLQPTTFDPQMVPVNASGLRCLDNDHVVTVQSGDVDQPLRPIHAHTTEQQVPVAATDGTQAAYAAGQSPPAGSIDDFVLQGLASGQGIFQFVSRRAHYEPERSRETPVIAHLVKHCRDHPDQLIGGRYKIISFARIAQTDTGDDFLRHELVAVDTWSENQTIVRVPITQAGLKFTDRLLRVKEIARASALLDAHNARVQLTDDAVAGDKMILSFAGIGRNATLITYRVLDAAIDSGAVTRETLDAALEAEIAANRLRRGPGYVHTPEQKDQLRAALLARIADREARAATSQV